MSAVPGAGPSGLAFAPGRVASCPGPAADTHLAQQGRGHGEGQGAPAAHGHRPPRRPPWRPQGLPPSGGGVRGRARAELGGRRPPGLRETRLPGSGRLVQARLPVALRLRPRRRARTGLARGGRSCSGNFRFPLVLPIHEWVRVARFLVLSPASSQEKGERQEGGRTRPGGRFSAQERRGPPRARWEARSGDPGASGSRPSRSLGRGGRSGRSPGPRCRPRRRGESRRSEEPSRCHPSEHARGGRPWEEAPRPARPRSSRAPAAGPRVRAEGLAPPAPRPYIPPAVRMANEMQMSGPQSGGAVTKEPLSNPPLKGSPNGQ